MATILHHEERGRGAPVVFLHPVGIDRHCWDDVADRLADRYRVVLIDHRGHGESPAATEGASLSDYAADVHATLASLALGPAAIVGLSFGGMVAQTLAIEWPGDVSRLCAAGCPCTLPPAGRTALAARGRAAREGGMAAVLDDTLARWFTAGFLASGGADGIRKTLLRTDPAAWDAAWQAISRIDTAARLHEVSVPTLCLAGEEDGAAPPAALAEIARRVPDGRLHVIAGAPHLMQIECPQPFLETVETFLAGKPIGDPVA